MNQVPVSSYRFKRISKGQYGMTVKAYRKWRKLKVKEAKKSRRKGK